MMEDFEQSRIRALDDQGRIELPPGLRAAFGWDTGTKLELSSDVIGGTVYMRALTPNCSLCRGKSEKIVKIGLGYVCPDCIAVIRV